MLTTAAEVTNRRRGAWRFARGNEKTCAAETSLFDASVSSEVSFEQFRALFAAGAWGLPGWLWKLAAFALIWGYLMHFCAGLRHLWMDATHAVEMEFGRQSALFTLAASLLLTVVLGARLFFF